MGHDFLIGLEYYDAHMAIILMNNNIFSYSNYRDLLQNQHWYNVQDWAVWVNQLPTEAGQPFSLTSNLCLLLKSSPTTARSSRITQYGTSEQVWCS